MTTLLHSLSRRTLAAAALAITALIAGFAYPIWHISQVPNTGRAADNRHWHAKDMHTLVGSAQAEGQHLTLRLDHTGRALIQLPMAASPADRYFFFHLTFEAPSVDATLLWRTSEAPAPQTSGKPNATTALHEAAIANEGWSGSWIELGGLEEWTDRVVWLGVEFRGSSGDPISLRKAQLLAATPAAMLAASIPGWTRHEPWSQRSINAYLAPAPTFLGGYRVPVVLGLLVAALSCYALVLIIAPARLNFDWRIMGTLFLLAWLALDAPWQWSLFRQLADTREAFAGKSAEEKGMASRDAILFELVEALQPLLEEHSGRIFVATSDEYLALRAVFRLLPHNTFWARRSDVELPEASQLNRDDFVLALLSDQLEYDSPTKVLRWPEDQSTSAEVLFTHPLGKLYRVL